MLLLLLMLVVILALEELVSQEGRLVQTQQGLPLIDAQVGVIKIGSLRTLHVSPSSIKADLMKCYYINYKTTT